MPPSTLDRMTRLLELAREEAGRDTPDVRMLAACVKEAKALLTPLDEVPTAVVVECMKAQADLLRIAGPLLADAVLGKPDADPAAPGGGVAWRIVDRDNLPEPQWMLVTNSLASQDAHGEMSHLWLTRMLHRAYDGSGS